MVDYIANYYDMDSSYIHHDTVNQVAKEVSQLITKQLNFSTVDCSSKNRSSESKKSKAIHK